MNKFKFEKINNRLSFGEYQEKTASQDHTYAFYRMIKKTAGKCRTQYSFLGGNILGFHQPKNKLVCEIAVCEIAEYRAVAYSGIWSPVTEKNYL